MNNPRCPWNTFPLAIYKKQQTLKLNRKRQQMMTLNCMWKLTGLVTQIIDTKDKYARPYWQVVVEVEAGLVMLFVHNEGLFPAIRDLKLNDIIEASGEITPKLGECHKPQFLNPTEIKVLVRI